MRYPNTRYGNPEELRYYSQGLTVKIIAKKLKRSEKSINAWLNGNRKIPFWVPELLRLWHMERDLTMRQMGFGDQRLKLGLISGNIICFPDNKKTIDEISTGTCTDMHHAHSIGAKQNLSRNQR